MAQDTSALDELLGLASEPYHTEIAIHEAAWSSDAATLRLRLAVTPGDETTQVWSVECADVANYNLVPGHSGSLSMEGDHPLVWPFLDDHVELFVRGRPASTLQVLGRLYDAHASLVQRWIPFERYLNRDISIPQLLAAGHGVLANGPERLLVTYGQVLEAEGLSTSLANRRAPQRQVGQRVFNVSPTIRVLVIGESYVVAEHFSAHRVATDMPH